MHTGGADGGWTGPGVRRAKCLPLPIPVVGEGNRESRCKVGTTRASTVLLRGADVLPGVGCASQEDALAQASLTQSQANC